MVDLGCGRAATSLFFAYYGANVISIDFSEMAILNLSIYCQDNGIRNITPLKMSAQEISKCLLDIAKRGAEMGSIFTQAGKTS